MIASNTITMTPMMATTVIKSWAMFIVNLAAQIHLESEVYPILLSPKQTFTFPLMAGESSKWRDERLGRASTGANRQWAFAAATSRGAHPPWQADPSPDHLLRSLSHRSAPGRGGLALETP